MKTKKWKVFMTYSFEMNSKNENGQTILQIEKQIRIDIEDKSIDEDNFTLEGYGEAAGYG